MEVLSLLFGSYTNGQSLKEQNQERTGKELEKNWNAVQLWSNQIHLPLEWPCQRDSRRRMWYIYDGSGLIDDNLTMSIQTASPPIHPKCISTNPINVHNFCPSGPIFIKPNSSPMIMAMSKQFKTSDVVYLQSFWIHR